MLNVHRFVTLDRVDAFRDGRQILRYVPDHRRFAVTVDHDGRLEAAIRAAIRDEPAALLPATTLAAWDDGGTRYALEPPSLCVDNACFSLASLDGIAFDEPAREIQLTWSTDEGITASLIGLFRTERPGRLRFDSSERYDAVADGFRDVAESLGIGTARRKDYRSH